MMLVLAFILSLFVALACLTLSRLVATRYLGIAAAAALLLCGAALLSAKARAGLPLAILDRAWITVDNRPLQVLLQFDAFSWAPALVGLLGGGVALLALALLVPSNLRGFGGLIAAALLAILAAVAGLANQALVLLPFAWSLVALLTFLALRASGALAGSDAPAIVLIAGLSGGLLVLGAALSVLGAGSDAPSGRVAAICWVLIGMLALGAPPFQAPPQRLAEAPAALAGMLLALGLPLLGGMSVLRFFMSQPAGLPTSLRGGLMFVGVLALLVCAAGALGATHLRRLLSWQFSAQMGLVLAAIAQGGTALAVVAPALLLNAVFATLLGYLAVAQLERRAGTDDLAAVALREPLFWPGILLLISAASAIGLPGFWGFWPRRWLLEAVLATSPWVLAPVLAGSTLMAVAFLPALAVFWRGAGASTPDRLAALGRERPTQVALICLIGALPLVILGIAPQIAWNGWLAALPGAAAAPSLPGHVLQATCAGAAALLIAAPALLRASRTAAHAAPVDASPAIVVPAALSESVAWLAWIGTATSAFARTWQATLRASRLLLRGLLLFEQRYYLAGLLIAVIVIIMLFIQ